QLPLIHQSAQHSKRPTHLSTAETSRYSCKALTRTAQISAPTATLISSFSQTKSATKICPGSQQTSKPLNSEVTALVDMTQEIGEQMSKTHYARNSVTH